MSNVCVIGGGAAGMMAAVTAAEAGNKVTLLEKNEKLGKKLYITGKGRCNLTNASDEENIFNNILKNKKFMYSALYSFNSDNVCDFFRSYGLEIKVERGNRVFPASDKSSDVISTLAKALKKTGAEVRLNSRVSDIVCKENNNDKYEKKIDYIILDNKEKLYFDKIIVATGGVSYQSTGSDGWGIDQAEKLGLKTVDLLPGLVPFNIKEEFVKDLQGLSLRNVSLEIKSKNKSVYKDFGEMLFTHFGISGPLVISASSVVNRLKLKEDLKIFIDLKPALSPEELDKRILRDFDEFKNKSFKNSLDKLLPKKLIPVIINLSGINPDKKVNEVSKKERNSLTSLLKNFEMTFSGLRGFNEAIITCGGISVNEINPATMESKKVENLFFCGEMLDVDAFTGGYNLQIAWSTGRLAGLSV